MSAGNFRWLFGACCSERNRAGLRRPSSEISHTHVLRKKGQTITLHLISHCAGRQTRAHAAPTSSRISRSHLPRHEPGRSPEGHLSRRCGPPGLHEGVMLHGSGGESPPPYAPWFHHSLEYSGLNRPVSVPAKRKPPSGTLRNCRDEEPTWHSSLRSCPIL